MNNEDHYAKFYKPQDVMFSKLENIENLLKLVLIKLEKEDTSEIQETKIT